MQRGWVPAMAMAWVLAGGCQVNRYCAADEDCDPGSVCVEGGTCGEPGTAGGTSSGAAVASSGPHVSSSSSSGGPSSAATSSPAATSAPPATSTPPPSSYTGATSDPVAPSSQPAPGSSAQPSSNPAASSPAGAPSSSGPRPTSASITWASSALVAQCAACAPVTCDVHTEEAPCTAATGCTWMPGPATCQGYAAAGGCGDLAAARCAAGPGCAPAGCVTVGPGPTCTPSNCGLGCSRSCTAAVCPSEPPCPTGCRETGTCNSGGTYSCQATTPDGCTTAGCTWVATGCTQDNNSTCAGPVNDVCGPACSFHCSSTPTPCAARDRNNCEVGSGCTWDSTCMGTPTTCGGITDADDCARIPGCEMLPTGGTCVAPTACPVVDGGCTAGCTCSATN